MGLIEQAAKRLEELRIAGYEAPESAAQPGAIRAVSPRSTPVAEPGISKSRRIELNLAKLAAQRFVTPDQPRSQIADRDAEQERVHSNHYNWNETIGNEARESQFQCEPGQTTRKEDFVGADTGRTLEV